MTENQTRTLVIVGALAIVVLIAAIAVWLQFLRDTAPPPASIESAVESVQSLPTSTATIPPTATTQAMTSGSPTSTEQVVENTRPPEPTPVSEPSPTEAAQQHALDGVWTIADVPERFVGYRIGEVLVTIGTTEAVGRTRNVVGSGSVENNHLVTATFTADLTTLVSDDSRRDGQLRNQALETNRFPEATFVLRSPVNLPDGLESGDAVQVVAPGILTLHGVSREIDMTLDLQLVGDLLVAVGSVELLLADYDIAAPHAGSVVSVDDHATLEVQLFFVRAGP